MAELAEVLVKIPTNLVRDAQEFDLLTDETITQLLREEVEGRFNEMVNEEIHAYREEKRAK